MYTLFLISGQRSSGLVTQFKRLKNEDSIRIFKLHDLFSPDLQSTSLSPDSPFCQFATPSHSPSIAVLPSVCQSSPRYAASPHDQYTSPQYASPQYANLPDRLSAKVCILCILSVKNYIIRGIILYKMCVGVF